MREGIEVRRDGPYIVRDVPLRADDGEELGVDETYRLCRCGRSSDKPFCDEACEAGFDGTETAHRGPIEPRRTAYAGDAITVFDVRRVCAHAAVCTDSLPAVFDVTRGRWIDPDAAPAEELADVVSRCPSGALSWAPSGGDDAVESAREPAIVCAVNASYIVRGGVELVGADGMPYARRQRITLCRCGASMNKPFCDGTHAEVGFRSG
jgi:CDGSH-type Zn-finger protein